MKSRMSAMIALASIAALGGIAALGPERDEPKPARPTYADAERKRAAEAKRARKAAKRAHGCRR